MTGDMRKEAVTRAAASIMKVKAPHHGRAGVLNVLIRAFGPQLGLDIVAYGWVQFWMIRFVSDCDPFYLFCLKYTIF